MLADYKAHRRPPRPPPRRKAGGALSPLSGGKEPQGGLPNPESGRWIWWEKKEDKDSPVFIPSTWSICDSHERSQRSALISAKRAGTARNAGEGSLLKERLRERARSVFFFFVFTRAVSSLESCACSALKQTTHRLCVSPAEKAFVCREEHTACNAICSRQVLVLLCTYSYRGSYPECLWDTANRNKLQQISTDTHRAVAEWQKLTPVPPHVLLCCLADYVTRLWRLAHLLDRLHMCSEHGYAGGVPLASFGRSSSSWRGTWFLPD